MKILLEDTWLADDIKTYAKDNFLICDELSVEELYNYDSIKFFNCVYFCNTDIVQFHLKNINHLEIVPNTYDNKYDKFYMRSIELIKFKEVKSGYFIKPLSNDKIFDGQIYEDNDKFIGKLPDPETIIYQVNKLTFLCEYRLLIGNKKLYGYGFIQGIYPNIQINKNDIVEEIVNLTSNYLCIDIGYTSELKKWVIVEINPPFSLDDHKIPLNDYMLFCIDACNYIRNLIKN